MNRLFKFSILAASMLLLQASSTSAQEEAAAETSAYPFYAGGGIGINDFGFGLSMQARIYKGAGAYADIGSGGWGAKLNAGLMYSFRGLADGPSLAVGYSHAQGAEAPTKLTFVNSPDSVVDVVLKGGKMHLVNAKFVISKSHGRKKKVKSEFLFGWAFPITTGYSVYKDSIKIKNLGDKLTPASKSAIRIIEPGGIILGYRFMVGI
jgi:hypothetical protein